MRPLLKSAAGIVSLILLALSFCACRGAVEWEAAPTDEPFSESTAEAAAVHPTEAAAVQAEETTAPTGQPYVLPDDYSTEYVSGADEYYAAACALLAGESIDRCSFPAYDQRVFFNREDDGLKVYFSKTVHVKHISQGETVVAVTYDGLIATLPAELADRANESLHRFADGCFLSNVYSSDSYLVSSGFYGGSYIVFTTEDDSIQDDQCIAVFCKEGGEWREIPACPGVETEPGSAPVPHTIAGAYAEGDTAYLCYSTKFLWSEETGWRYPYIYRTADGGGTWQRLNIELPEDFVSAPWVSVLSPVFNGRHGVMLLAEGFNGRPAWLETNDGGVTWEFKTQP